MEAIDDLRERLFGPIDVPERHVDLEDLLAIAHVDRAVAAHRSFERHAQPPAALGLHGGKHSRNLIIVETTCVPHMTPGNLDAQISRQHAPSGEYGGRARYDH